MPHVRNGVKYNDEQYLVKLARPADVIAEPLYANNKPEHYAVSNANAAALLQDTEGGAAGGRCPSPLPNDKVEISERQHCKMYLGRFLRMQS